LAQGNNDIIYTAADIEKYHKGQLSPKEMHALEKAALDDPFLADALEGYSVKGISANADMDELKSRLARRIEQDSKVIPLVPVKKTTFNWWKVAAMIIVIAGAGLLAYQLNFSDRRAEIAHAPASNKATKSPASDSAKKDSQSIENAAANQGFAATEQQDKAGSEVKAVRPDSPVPGDKRALKKILDSTDDKEALVSTISEPAASAILEGKKEALASKDDNQPQKNGYAKRSDPDVKAQRLEKRAANEDMDEKLLRTNPGLVMQKNARAKSNNALTHTNVFKGRITDAQNNALPFSNITNTEDNIGTYSDAKGNFVLTSPDSVLNVQVSSVGFETSKVQLQNNVPANNIELKEDRSLAEVVIADKKVNSKRARDANMVLEEPEPADGWSNYDIYLANNLKTPEVFKDKQADTKGEVVLSFDVDKDGNPYNITVKKSLCESCDKEAIRLVKEGPKWKRKARKGKATVKIAF
jgi:hypothetical protein